MLDLKVLLLMSILNLGISMIETIPNYCARECDDMARECKYYFEMEWYLAMGRACFDCPTNLTDCARPDCLMAAGFQRGVAAINRQLPGPTIEVCQGDTIVVTLMNRMINGASTTLHWHGILMKETPYMDGVPFVTQCPIPYNTHFTYRFVANKAGTYFYHSHMGSQRSDGAFGALIVRESDRNNELRTLYDEDRIDHVIQVIDWTRNGGDDVLLRFWQDSLSFHPDAILVNGLGSPDPGNLSTSPWPIARFIVRKGRRYRFRMINAGFNDCPIELQIDGHPLTLIASDGEYFAPLLFDSLRTHSGERFDFIVNAFQAVGLYWMRFRGQLLCKSARVYQLAVLQYEGSELEGSLPPGPIPTYDDFHSGWQFNNDNDMVNNLNMVQSLRPLEEHFSEHQRVIKRFIEIDFNWVNHPMYYRDPYNLEQDPPAQRRSTPQFDNISFKNAARPLLPNKDHNRPADFCSWETMQERNCSNTFCSCPYVIQFPLNSVVELIIIDINKRVNAVHPIHLHGHKFRLMASQKLEMNATADTVRSLDEAGLIHRNFQSPPVKDTVAICHGGYTVIRFEADNPGFWLMHCHVETHQEVGMALIIQVGKPSDMKPVPQSFPTCESYN